MKSHNIDKALSFGLVIVGLVFLYFTQANTSIEFVGIVVVIAGAMGLVSSQALAPLIQMLEKAYGVNFPVPSPTPSSTPSQQGQQQPSSVTTSTAGTANTVAPPGLGG